jgi:TP901 family phage tail tape measure protein
MPNLKLASAFVEIGVNTTLFDAGLSRVFAELARLRGQGMIPLNVNRGAATSSLNLLRQQLDELKKAAEIQVRTSVGGPGGGGGAGGLRGMLGGGGTAGQALTGAAMGLGMPLALNPAMMVGQMIGTGLRDAVGAAIQLEDQFIDLQRVSGDTAENVGNFRKTLFAIAEKQPGSSIQDLVEISSTGAKMGVTDKEGMAGLERFTSAMARVRNVVSGIGTEQLANDTARMLNLFHKGTDYVESFGSALVRMDNVSTSSAADILDISKSLSGTFQSLGMTIPQVMAFSSVISDVGLTNQQGASSFSQILRMMASQSEKFAEAIGMPVEKFQQAIRTNAMDALGMLIAKFRELNEVDPIKAQEFISGLGFRGVKTAGALQQLSSMFEDVQKRTAMAVEEESTLGSLIAGNELKANSTKNQLLNLTNAFVELGAAIGQHVLGPLGAMARASAEATRGLSSLFGGEGGTGDKMTVLERMDLATLKTFSAMGISSEASRARQTELEAKLVGERASERGLKFEAGPVTAEEKKAGMKSVPASVIPPGADPQKVVDDVAAFNKAMADAAEPRAEREPPAVGALRDRSREIALENDRLQAETERADRGAMLARPELRPPTFFDQPISQISKFAQGFLSDDEKEKAKGIEQAQKDAGKKFDQSRKENLFRSETFSDPADLARKAIETALSQKEDAKTPEQQLDEARRANTFLQQIVDNLKVPGPFAPQTSTGMLILKGPEGPS